MQSFKKYHRQWMHVPLRHVLFLHTLPIAIVFRIFREVKTSQ